MVDFEEKAVWIFQKKLVMPIKPETLKKLWFLHLKWMKRPFAIPNQENKLFCLIITVGPVKCYHFGPKRKL